MKLTTALLACLCGLSVSLFGQMTPQYSYYTNYTYSPTTRTMTASVTTSGNTTFPPSCGSQCYSAFHHAAGTNQLKLHGVVVAGGSYAAQSIVSPPSQQLNYTNTISADWSGCDIAGANDCVGTGDGNAGVECSVAGLISTDPFSFQIEAAFTRADWVGTPPPTCWQLPASKIWQCNYQVANNCTPETTPPDNDFNGALIGPNDYRGIATYLSWMTVATCSRHNASGPWTCWHGLAWLQGMNSRFPPFACTHNP